MLFEHRPAVMQLHQEDHQLGEAYRYRGTGRAERAVQQQIAYQAGGNAGEVRLCELRLLAQRGEDAKAEEVAHAGEQVHQTYDAYGKDRVRIFLRRDQHHQRVRVDQEIQGGP